MLVQCGRICTWGPGLDEIGERGPALEIRQRGRQLHVHLALQQTERWPDLLIERDDFAVHDAVPVLDCVE